MILIDEGGAPAATEVAKDLYVIRGGGADESAQRVFLSPQFGTFLEAAKAQSNLIVIDSPPAVVVADAAILARYADVVLHVVRWGRTGRWSCSMRLIECTAPMAKQFASQYSIESSS